MTNAHVCWLCGFMAASAILLWWFPIADALAVGLFVMWLLSRR